MVEFCGYEIGPDYVRPSSKFFSALENIKRPETIKDVRAIFGLVEQFAYSFHCSAMMAPFRDLLKPSNLQQGKVLWTDELDVAFREAKAAMKAAMEEGVRIYNPKLPTAVQADWSQVGIGQVLSQKHCSCPGPSAPGCLSLIHI